MLDNLPSQWYFVMAARVKTLEQSFRRESIEDQVGTEFKSCRDVWRRVRILDFLNLLYTLVARV